MALSYLHVMLEMVSINTYTILYNRLVCDLEKKSDNFSNCEFSFILHSTYSACVLNRVQTSRKSNRDSLALFNRSNTATHVQFETNSRQRRKDQRGSDLIPPNSSLSRQSSDTQERRRQFIFIGSAARAWKFFRRAKRTENVHTFSFAEDRSSADIRSSSSRS